jgi:hypothetical protein
MAKQTPVFAEPTMGDNISLFEQIQHILDDRRGIANVDHQACSRQPSGLSRQLHRRDPEIAAP